MTIKFSQNHNIPIGLQEDQYYEMINELMHYIDEKGLTARQVQNMFEYCINLVHKSQNTNQTSYKGTVSTSISNSNNFIPAVTVIHNIPLKWDRC